MVENIWDEARLMQYIKDEIEESLTLEYKESRALHKDKKTDISKDVSAMANSAGGVIIYGVDERKHGNTNLPKGLSPIDRSQYSKEWLEQVINSNILPKIDGIIIHSVQLSSTASNSNDIAYVVEIPQSNTAHQAADKRYHKRFNFQILMMEDHEIRDVMNRSQHPKIELDFQIEVDSVNVNSGMLGGIGRGVPQYVDAFTLKIRASNIGNVYANYIQAFFTLPSAFLPMYHERISGSDGDLKQRITHYKDQVPQYTFNVNNMVKDYIGSPPMNAPYVKRYEPLLPKLGMLLSAESLSRDFEKLNVEDFIIEWVTYADNAPPYQSRVLGKDIPIIDNRNKGE